MTSTGCGSLRVTRTRNFFNGYDTLTKSHVELEGVEQTRVGCRRMHPAAPGDQEYRNYISDLAGVPVAQGVAKHDVESLESETDSDGAGPLSL